MFGEGRVVRGGLWGVSLIGGVLGGSGGPLLFGEGLRGGSERPPPNEAWFGGSGGTPKVWSGAPRTVGSVWGAFWGPYGAGGGHRDEEEEEEEEELCPQGSAR